MGLSVYIRGEKKVDKNMDVGCSTGEELGGGRRERAGIYLPSSYESTAYVPGSVAGR
jgi:hypothetical protein